MNRAAEAVANVLLDLVISHPVRVALCGLALLAWARHAARDHAAADQGGRSC